MKLLIFLALCISTVLAGTFKMPIQKQMPDQKTMEYRRLNNLTMPGKKSSRFNKGQQSFIDFIDNFYLGEIALGEPSQSFRIVLDTGSSNLWVVDDSCTISNCDGLSNPIFGPTYHKHKFHRSQSSSFKDDGTFFNYTYGTGWSSGKQVYDTLSFGGLTVKNQGFGAASIIDEIFGYSPVDGILGLGFPALADNDVDPPFENLIPQLDSPLFTVWLDRHVKPSMGKSGGLITYGALDSENCDISSIVYAPISRDLYWQFEINSFAVGKYKKVQSAQVISDTGTSFLSGPPNEISQIVDASNAQYDFYNQLYTVPCDSAKDIPDVIFTVNGNPLAVPGVEYVVDLELGGGQCAVGIDGFEDESIDWILGDAFIRTYCNVYDVGGNQIGLAKAHHKEV